MSLNLLQERYQEGASPLHRFDARVKVAVALILMLGITLTPAQAWPAYPLLWALITSLALVGEIQAVRLARLGGLALPFVLAAATLLFTTPGDSILVLGPLTISDAGLARFVAILLKSWLSVQVALLLAMTTPFVDLLWALHRLRVPGTLIAIMSFMYRYLFMLQDEAQRLMRARAARSGGTQRGSLLFRARVTGGMIGSLLLRSMERSERIYTAMIARGYAGQFPALNPPVLSRRTVLWGSVPVLALVGIEVCAVLWWGR